MGNYINTLGKNLDKVVTKIRNTKSRNSTTGNRVSNESPDKHSTQKRHFNQGKQSHVITSEQKKRSLRKKRLGVVSPRSDFKKIKISTQNLHNSRYPILSYRDNMGSNKDYFMETQRLKKRDERNNNLYTEYDYFSQDD